MMGTTIFRDEDRQRTIQYLARAGVGIDRIDPADYPGHEAAVGQVKDRILGLFSDAYLITNGLPAEDGLDDLLAAVEDALRSKLAGDIAQKEEAQARHSLAQLGFGDGMAERDGQKESAEFEGLGSEREEAKAFELSGSHLCLCHEGHKIPLEVIIKVRQFGQDVPHAAEPILDILDARLARLRARGRRLVQHRQSPEQPDVSRRDDRSRLIRGVVVRPVGLYREHSLVAAEDQRLVRWIGPLLRQLVDEVLHLGQKVDGSSMGMPVVDSRPRSSSRASPQSHGLLRRDRPRLKQIGQLVHGVVHVGAVLRSSVAPTSLSASAPSPAAGTASTPEGNGAAGTPLPAAPTSP